MNGGSFDLNSQSGVMLLLAAIRQSETISADQKADLRDLVFSYTNGGGDATVRRTLEQKIATHGLVPVAPGKKQVAATSVTPEPAVVRQFPVGRPAPQFSPVSIVGHITPPVVSQATAPASVAPPDVPARVPVAAETPAPVPVPEPVPQPVTPPPVAPVPAPVPTPNQAVSLPVTSLTVESEPVPEQPVPVSVPERLSVPPAAVQSPAPVPSPIQASAPESVAAFDPEAARQRILEIKAAVNQRVGNPVNLVDIDNTVGREYMIALLEAMKRVGGGMPGDLGVAMVRLEAAYAAVLLALQTHGVGAPAGTPMPAVVSETVRVADPAPAPAPMPDPVIAPPPVAQAPQPVTAPAPVPVAVQQPRVQAVPLAAPAPVSAPVAAPAATPAPVEPMFRATSLAEDTTRVLTPKDLPDAAALETSSVSGDPLYTKEVETGLAQLLLEWEIFKKSGLFGTGPRGYEHPLFKTLAVMTIPAILAGKFEGSTPEVRQSVTDYMNGWRYEHGIVHSQDETFERYLRRVVRYIIDLQKKRTQA